MSSMIDYPSGFDIAYKGYQYPLPPSWKYAIRLEDQIQWILQALLLINDTAVSQDILDEGLADNLEAMQEYADNLYQLLHNLIAEHYVELDERINNVYAGVSRWASPVSGNYHYAPYIDHELFNASRPYAASVDEFSAYFTDKGYTIDQANTELADYTLYQLAIYTAVILGLCEYGNYEQVLARCAPYSVDEYIYRPTAPSIINTWNELKQYGALTYKEVINAND